MTSTVPEFEDAFAAVAAGGVPTALAQFVYDYSPNPCDPEGAAGAADFRAQLQAVLTAREVEVAQGIYAAFADAVAALAPPGT